MKELRKVESWFTHQNHDEHFTVELKHWYIDYSPSRAHDGRTLHHKWNIYIHVFKEHPMHGQLVLTKPYYNQNIIMAIPMHGGCTFFEEGVRGAIDIGCDYSHYQDEGFNSLAIPNHKLAEDVKAIYDHMINYKVKPTAISEGTVNTGDSDGTNDN